ncbi:MAG: cytochrome c3 family protein [Bacteroidetes bacterium]|nr:cytochrome c3 family protein [Bacteroidota bacterium]
MAIKQTFHNIVRGTFLFIFVSGMSLFAQNEDCLECHSDDSMTYERNGKEMSLFIHADKFAESIHGELECVECHVDFDPAEEPHREGTNIYKVDCSNCHDVEAYKESVHFQKGLNCADCHSSHEIKETSELKKNIEQFCITCHKNANVKNFTKSVHFAKLKEGETSPTCLDCHNGSTHQIQPAKFSENELHDICRTCHKVPVANFENSLHGKALSKQKVMAPNCITCHNSHDIRSGKDQSSKTYVMNIPKLCGNCHKDGTDVSTLKNIDQRHILENYSESIHGEGLLKKGLIVSAVCTSCHFSHSILPHEDINSSINRKNIANTCMQCHQQIEKVHQQVINGELWEKNPNSIPVCIDCHQPHQVRRVFYEQDYTNDYCMTCHKDQNLSKVVNGEKVSLYVNIDDHNNSAHKEKTCINCHSNVSTARKPVCINSGKVDCSTCHAGQVDDFNLSTHGIKLAAGDKHAPECIDCHGKHNILKKDNTAAPTFARNIPNLCGKCHKADGRAEKASSTPEGSIVENYKMSIHGKGLLESGLMVTATCVDCHTAHKELPASDLMSSVNQHNVANTCAKCHLGILEKFNKSIHSPLVTKTDKELPGCRDCHKSHTIERTDLDDFRQGIYTQCGRCHEEVTATYFETFHGKVSKLGSVKTAKCYDCHGSHDILPTYMPESKLSRENVVETCKTCHPQSNKKFVGYLTHATHHDKDKYPFLYYTFWGMTILLLSTFTFFGLHTLLWLPRALAEKKKHNKQKKQIAARKEGTDDSGE